MVRPSRKGITLSNGDGFSFVARNGDVCGFRGDVCEGNAIRCKSIQEIFVGAVIYRNISAAFEKELERNACTRMISVNVNFAFSLREDGWDVCATAESEDGRKVSRTYDAGDQVANNRERMLEMIKGQTGKNTGTYSFCLDGITGSDTIPFMSASFLNSIRRDIAQELDSMPCGRKDLLLRDVRKVDKGIISIPQKKTSYKNNISNRLSQTVYLSCGADSAEPAYELSHISDAELMRTKYCVRYELGMCPKHHGCKNTGPLYLLNNGQRFVLRFDCRTCEMTLSEA